MLLPQRALTGAAVLLAGALLAGESRTAGAQAPAGAEHQPASQTAPPKPSRNPGDRFRRAFGPKLPAVVDAFDYELSMRTQEHWTHYDQFQVGGMSILLQGRATGAAKGRGKIAIVLMKTRVAPGLIDLAAVQASDLAPRGDFPVKERPWHFRAEIHSLVVPPDRPALLRICFRDQTHVYALDYEDGQGLTLRDADMHNRQFGARAITDFKQVQIEDGKRRITCSPLGIAATQAGRPLWQRDIVMHGQPQAMRRVGDTFFVTTDQGHSFYVRRDTGELVFYHDDVLPGKAPLAEIVGLGRDVIAGRSPQKLPCLGRFIRGAGVLEDRAAAPFLIDAIAAGYGQGEKCLAVACLERLNGNADLFNMKGARPGDTILHVVGSKRVYPPANNRAEQAKWRKVFGVQEK